MHIITNLYSKISLKFILKSKFTIYMHKKLFASYITIHFIQKKIYTWFNLFMKIDNLFWFVLSCWDFLTQIVSYIAIDIFENLTMSRGVLSWVENFWNYNAKIGDFESFCSLHQNIAFMTRTYCD
jgi:hypothetical protein